MRRSRLTLRIFVASLTLGLALGLVSLSTLGYRVETVTLDAWFSLRYKLFGAQSIDPRLLMVGIDDPTMEMFGKPQLLWQKDLANLISKIKESRPAVIGLDLVISPATHSLSADDPLNLRLQDEALELGLVSTEGPPVVLIEVYSEGTIVHGQGDKDGVVSPHELILDLLLDENGDTDRLGIANLVGDADGVLRRAKLFHRKQKGFEQGRPANLALLLLEHATGEAFVYTRHKSDSTLTWRDRSVPLLFEESFLLNYPGPTENNTGELQKPEDSLSFPIVSGSQILDGSIPAETFQDKIVLIAPTASSLSDEKIVPGDPQYHGGAVHLTTLNMFLQDQFIARSRAWWVVLCLLFSVLGIKVGRFGKIWPGVLALCSVPVLSFAAFSGLGIWLPSTFPLLVVGATILLGYAERLLTVERDRALVRSTFARMVSPQVMHHVLANYRSLKSGQRKEITVLFSDINDFTPVCENHEPEEVIEMLSEYFSKMVEVIMKYDGYLKQYVGDEIMVIYGAPDDSEDHATRAVLTALEMRKVLAEAKEESMGKPGFFDVKIGINTGSVVVGKVGPESRWEYAAVGDNVNLGARVMSVAKNMGMDIGVSAATKARYEKEMKENSTFGDQVEWISKGVQSFKGKISQMEVFAVNKRDKSN